jgi:glycine/D-amino acid oxidase-like deaminating enzyme
MSKAIDYLIVGQGLAGSFLAHELIKNGQKVFVVDNPNGPSSSKVSAGIFNPVTGKRFVKTWLCDEIYPNIIPFYQKLEKELGANFLNIMPIFRPVSNTKEQNQIISLCNEPGLKPYINFQNSLGNIGDLKNYLKFEKDFGALSTNIGGWVNVPILLESFKAFLKINGSYLAQCIDYKDIVISKYENTWENIRFKKMIFCEGYGAVKNPFFKWLPFNAVKGEIINISANINLKNHVLLNGIFVLPTGENTFKVGATYNWEDKTTEITYTGRKILEHKLDKLLKNKSEFISQEAGIRPATVDRRPFLGMHQKYNQMGVFNGFGTKAVSLGPYFATHFVKFLLKNEQLMDDVNINRFSSLYLSSETV